MRGSSCSATFQARVPSRFAGTERPIKEALGRRTRTGGATPTAACTEPSRSRILIIDLPREPHQSLMINSLSAACPQESKWKQMESGRQSAAAVPPYLSRVWGVWASHPDHGIEALEGPAQGGCHVIKSLGVTDESPLVLIERRLPCDGTRVLASLRAPPQLLASGPFKHSSVTMNAAAVHCLVSSMSPLG
jgi:hypothetical protein